MTGREALISAARFLTGACVTALLLHVPAWAADATGSGGFMVSDSTGPRPVRPPPLPPRPPPANLPESPITYTKDGDAIFKGGPEKGGFIITH